MALQIQVTKASVSNTGDKLFIDDTTGAYSSPDNEGGYGAPNEDRVDLGLLMVATQERTDASNAVVLDTHLPETVTQWGLATPADGWYMTNTYAARLFVNATTDYAVDEVTYDAGSSEIRRITGGTTNTWTFDVITDADLADAQNIFISEVLYNTFTLVRLTNTRYKLLKKYFADPTDAKLDEYLEFDAKLKGVEYAFGLEQWADGQKMVENLEAFEDCVTSVQCDLN